MIVKKIILAILGISFALAITACNDRDKKSQEMKKQVEKDLKPYSRKW